MKNYNIKIDGKNFYDQPIKGQIKKYIEIKQTAIGQGYGYTTGCLLDYKYFKQTVQVIATDIYKQKVLDADPTAIQQILFTGKVETNSIIYYIFEQPKETNLEFYKETAKVL